MQKELSDPVNTTITFQSETRPHRLRGTRGSGDEKEISQGRYQSCSQALCALPPLFQLVRGAERDRERTWKHQQETNHGNQPEVRLSLPFTFAIFQVNDSTNARNENYASKIVQCPWKQRASLCESEFSKLISRICMEHCWKAWSCSSTIFSIQILFF